MKVGDPALARARTLFLSLRILLLALAATAVAVGVTLGRIRDRSSEASGIRYVCPMHPEVRASAPGECPICRMQLEAVSPKGAVGPASAIIASPYQTYDYVRQRAFGQPVRAAAWVEDDGLVAAVLYKDELVGLLPAEPGTFSSSTTPNTNVVVRLAPEPPRPWDRSTSLVRFRADSGALTPGDVGWLKMPAKRRELQVVPYASVLEDQDGAYVLVASPDGQTLRKRAIELGRVIGGQAIVLSGLRLLERISVRSAFLLDAERRLHGETSIELAP